jgi:hypothetical protein
MNSMRAFKPFATLVLASALIAPSMARADNTAGSTLTFSTGATITLPVASVTPASERNPPDGAVSARMFLLDETSILAVTEIALARQTCEKAIAAEWAQMQKNVASRDPNMKALSRINKAERRRWARAPPSTPRSTPAIRGKSRKARPITRAPASSCASATPS